MSEHGPDLPRDLAAELRLRPERPPVMRLSRRVLMALVAFATISVSGALIWALSQGQRKSTGARSSTVPRASLRRTASLRSRVITRAFHLTFLLSALRS